MHDPMTVAFDIRAPWFKTIAGRRYHSTLLTIWHVDPETDGSDDSCGWSYVKMTKAQRDTVRKLGEEEQVFINGEHGYAMAPAELVLEVWQTIAARMFNRPRWSWRRISHRELLYVLNLANCPSDNLRYTCGKATTPEGMASLFQTVLRCYLTFHRPWWRHPRWHVHHWRLQVPVIQSFKRWAFSRCAGCGKRFTFGYCPTSHSWDSDPPRWFRSERHVYHSECSNQKAALARIAPHGEGA